MNKIDLKYLLIPLGYISSLIAMEVFPNILFIGLFLLMLIASVVALVLLSVNRRKRPAKLRVALAALALVPFIDLAFGLSTKLRDELKGPIVFSIVDDGFASSKGLTIRKKGAQLMAEYDTSVAGIGNTEPADVTLRGDTIVFKLTEREYEDKVVLDRRQNVMKSVNSNTNFRILINQLIE
jgi:hypothetical protein